MVRVHTYTRRNVHKSVREIVRTVPIIHSYRRQTIVRPTIHIPPLLQILQQNTGILVCTQYGLIILVVFEAHLVYKGWYILTAMIHHCKS